MKNPLKGLRSVPKVQKNDCINDSLVSFVVEIMYDKLCPLMFSHHCLRRLRNLLFLAWPIRASVGST